MRFLEINQFLLERNLLEVKGNFPVEQMELFILKFTDEIDQWLKNTEKSLQEYDVFLYKIVLEGSNYTNEIRQAVLADFIEYVQKENQ